MHSRRVHYDGSSKVYHSDYGTWTCQFCYHHDNIYYWKRCNECNKIPYYKKVRTIGTRRINLKDGIYKKNAPLNDAAEELLGETHLRKVNKREKIRLRHLSSMRRSCKTISHLSFSHSFGSKLTVLRRSAFAHKRKTGALHPRA